MKMSRRVFLKGGLSGVGVTALNLSSPIAHAFGQECNDNMPYKALVGINLAGGNDGFNCFVPKDTKQYPEYAKLRSHLAIKRDDIIELGIDDNSLKLGLSPELKELEWLFERKMALPVLNVGPLMMERGKEQEVDELKPIHLFSHNHQSAVTQTHTSEQITNQGWGGLSANLLENAFGLEELPPLFEVGSQTVWTNSIPKSANRIGTSMPDDMVLKSQGRSLYEAFRESSLTEGSLYKEYYSELCVDAEDKFVEFRAIFEDDDDYGFDLDTSIGKQLRVVFLLLRARDEFQQPAQFFSVTLGGFDTHSAQEAEQGALLRLLASQVSIFYQCLEQHNLIESVTTFTFSEFGRTLEPNGSGTDHGWGNCQMVIGGDVIGGRVLGEWPNLASNSDDLLTRGRVIPSLSVDLFHASLLKWIGVRRSGIECLFPTLQDFEQKALPIFHSCDTGGDSVLAIRNASASATNPNGIDKVEHAIDGNFSTKWSAKGFRVFYTIELAALSEIHSVRFAQAKGNERQYFMEIETSTDGVNFVHARKITTSGTTEEMAEYSLAVVEGKYIRFKCEGNNDVDGSLQEWNNFKHIEVIGR
ncbi:DUF1501 domain-containing protein [Vibrio mediterranei]|uniref:DUF1501 domain-containing protein n=1 Tax=Vibrio mediterranei TaxID=689 RepID=UPI001EFDAFCB|nr:DUF1501 domain-containing protein [Vibrio mediterranei]MCG9661912.1 DUF1501 domain-containing protein [Vibrio mediterranei]